MTDNHENIIKMKLDISNLKSEVSILKIQLEFHRALNNEFRSITNGQNISNHNNDKQLAYDKSITDDFMDLFDYFITHIIVRHCEYEKNCDDKFSEDYIYSFDVNRVLWAYIFDGLLNENYKCVILVLNKIRVSINDIAEFFIIYNNKYECKITQKKLNVSNEESIKKKANVLIKKLDSISEECPLYDTQAKEFLINLIRIVDESFEYIKST